jgi:hypothetical protein
MLGINKSQGFPGKRKVGGTADGQEFGQALNDSEKNSIERIHSVSVMV